jgi:hypothetical protein
MSRILIKSLFNTCRYRSHYKGGSHGAELVAFIAGLSDDELDRKGSMPAFGGDVTVNQVIEFVIFQSAQQHFDSMKTAGGR